MRRSGFTLVELLVVLVITVLLASFVISALRPGDQDKVSLVGRQLQALVMRAKTSAVSDRSVRGVRFERSVSDPRVCSAASLVDSAGFVDGTLADLRIDARDLSTRQDDVWTVTADFTRMSERELVHPGSHLRVGDQWMIVTELLGDKLVLAGHYQFSYWDAAADKYVVKHAWDPRPMTNPPATRGGLREDVKWRLELEPTVLANVPGFVFPKGVLVDIDASQVPDSWRAPNAHWDLLFDAEGATHGGVINLFITRQSDVELTRGMFPNHPSNGGSQALPIVPGNAPHVPALEPCVVTVIPRTGYCYAGPADLRDSNGDLQADDPWSYARLGGR